jgi:glyoxylase-like metal-dependent hydrolase (beta-lactamase superfamily II)
LEVKCVPGRPFDCNIYLLIEDRAVILVDAGTGRGQKRMLDGILPFLEGREFLGTALTHEHFDHSGGARAINERLGGEVWCGNRCARVVAGPDSLLTGSFLFGATFEPPERVTVIEGRLRVGPFDLSVIQTPGHSEGSICLFDEGSGSLFCGDLIFCDGGVGRWDLPGGDLGTLKRSISHVLELPVRALYPGHGRAEVNDPLGEMRQSASSLGAI